MNREEIINKIEVLKSEIPKLKTQVGSKKLILNATFGKTNDQYSSLYDPFTMASITVTGQLALLVLIAMLEDLGATVVSANTDGMTVIYKKNNKDAVRAAVTEWETLTGLEMEYLPYKGLYQRDVNNYVAITTDGEVKTKGVFAIPAEGKIDLEHNPNNQVSSKAVIDHLSKGADVNITVTECQDIQKFLMTQQVKGKWAVNWNGEKLGKMVRFYKSVDGHPIIKTPTCSTVKGNAGVVARSENSVPLPDLPESFHTIRDIDYRYYIDEALDLLVQVMNPKKKYMNTVAMHFVINGMTPTLITKGVSSRASVKPGEIDFSSIKDSESLAVCTGRHYGVLAKRYADGRTKFYKVDRKYKSRTRDKIMKDHGFELLFGSNVEAVAYSMLHSIDEDFLETFYTDTELRDARK